MLAFTDYGALQNVKPRGIAAEQLRDDPTEELIELAVQSDVAELKTNDCPLEDSGGLD